MTESWFRCYSCSKVVLVKFISGRLYSYNMDGGDLHYCGSHNKSANPSAPPPSVPKRIEPSVTGLWG